MKLKFLSLEDLGSAKFKVRFRQDDQLKSMIISESRHWIEEIQDFLPVINSEYPDFYEIWGQNLSFRQEISKELEKMHSLQPI